MTIELGTLIREQESELKEVAASLVEGNASKIAAGLATLVLAVATGHPEVAALSPFLEAGARRAFVAPATRRLQSAIAEAKAQEDEAGRVNQIVEPIEALIGQALIQMVNVQHRTKDEIVEALGGLRSDLADFRNEVQERLEDQDVRIDVQRVRDGATGIRISHGARARVWIGEMTVSGSGSVGIDLGRR